MVEESYFACNHSTMTTKKDTTKTLTKSLTKREVTLFAVYLLGGGQRAVDTEDVAVKAAELLPGAFAWRKYPDQINLELVRAVLSDSKKLQFGQLLHGTGTEGWRLSDAGVRWAVQTQRAMRAGSVKTGSAERWAGSSDARRADREVRRVKSGQAWEQWKSGEGITAKAALQLFRIDDYADAQMRDIKIARLRELVTEDQEAAKFVEIAAKIALGGK
jgi:hypothetical protein